MLLQHIAGLVQAITAENDAGTLARDEKLLARAWSDMAMAHQGLMQGDPARNLPGIRSPIEATYYYAPPYDIDAKLQAYLGDVETFLGQTDKTSQVRLAKKIVDVAHRDLPAALNTVVAFYEIEARTNTVRAETVHLWLTLATLATLIGEAIFIFLPLVRELSLKERAVYEKQNELTYHAFHDHLTGLFNRRHLREHVGTLCGATKGGAVAPFSLIVIDLDNFKDVNDSAGHDLGDRLLRTVAATLQANVRGHDLAFRLGGDEFLVVIHASDTDTAEQVAERIRCELQQSLSRESGCAAVAASFGIASSPAHGTSFEQVLANADIALYHAKAGGKNAVAVFEESLRASFETRRQDEAFIRTALAASAFEPFFQPQLDMATGKVTGIEALARCRDAQGAIVPPSRFIHLAEETGLIVPLGEQVVANAIRTAKTWLDQGIPFGRLSVNASSAQLRGGFANFLEAILHETGFPPSRLSVEILETVFLDDDDRIVEIIATLRGLGVAIELDDFGTGHTSIANLNRLKVERIKIDRSFIEGLGEAGAKVHVLTAILTMARALAVDVIAEGIETREQEERLVALGCINGQGYRFAKPMSAQDFETWSINDTGTNALRAGMKNKRNSHPTFA